MTASPQIDFFKTGGTLRPGDPSYIRRPADDELYTQLLAGHYCYVLTSRQRGKSSLMVHTAERLRQAGTAVAIVDLSAIGTQASPEAWYFGIITRLTIDLSLPVDARAWWRARAATGPVQRLNEFLDEIVLQEIQTPIVSFLDEIDTTLAIDFSDDFFAGIRQLYNLRATNPAYERLTFALLGVATPTDLIKDPNRTPFNIGRAIALGEFRRADAARLEAPLDTRFPGRGRALLDRVFFWTSGHPYLTQRLCQALADLPPGSIGDVEVDALVQRIFLSDEAHVENNLRYVHSAVEALPAGPRRAALRLYRQVLGGAAMAEDQRAPEQERLRLIGLIRAEQGRLKVRNEIYRRVFDAAWIRALMPVDRTRVATIAAEIVILLALIAGGILYYRQAEENNRIALIGALSQRCGLPDQRAGAIDDFLQLDPAKRSRLLDPSSDDRVWHDQVALANCIRPELARVGDPAEHQALANQICCVLSASGGYTSEVEGATECSCEKR